MTNLFPLSGRVESLPPVDQVTDKIFYPDKSEELVEVSKQPLNRLQLSRMYTQDFALNFFKDANTHISYVAPLKKERFSSWEDLQSSGLIVATKRAMQAKHRALIMELQEERLQEYLLMCWRQLKDSFRQQYLKLLLKQQAIKDFVTKSSR